MKEVVKKIYAIYETYISFFCLLSAILVLFLDYLTGKNIEFPILYALPVGIAAWNFKNPMSYALSTILPLTRAGFLYLWNDIHSVPVVLINTSIIVLALSTYAYLISKTASQKISLEKKVKVLTGILPICAGCQKIRNEKGEYERIEKYVSEHSDAQFSHGLCLDCTKRLYPDAYATLYPENDGII